MLHDVSEYKSPHASWNVERQATGSWLLIVPTACSFDDGELSVLIDDQDEMEFALQGEDEDENEDASLEAETGIEALSGGII